MWATLAGCMDGEPQLVPVSGKVLIDGKPVTRGVIRFVPKQGRPFSSAILADGSFDLASPSVSKEVENRGVYPGRYRVAVAASELIGEDSIRWYAPKMYADFRTSGLEITVDKPTDNLTVELTWGDLEGPVLESSSSVSDSTNKDESGKEADESGTASKVNTQSQ